MRRQHVACRKPILRVLVEVFAQRSRLVYVQIGAGAGDLDVRGGCRDGFTETVKAIDPSFIESILLVEPNPVNHEKLCECWKDWNQATVFPVAVIPETGGCVTAIFYYHPDDGPHFQTCSMLPEHVIAHYVGSSLDDLKSFEVTAMSVRQLLEKMIPSQSRNVFLSMDVEGLDYEILRSLPLARIMFANFEAAHMSASEKEFVHRRLLGAGFRQLGCGLDPNGFDLLYGRMSAPEFIRFQAEYWRVFVCESVAWGAKKLSHGGTGSAHFLPRVR